MKTLLITATLGLFATTLAQADGFVCQAQNTGAIVKVYNHTDSAAGTRTPAVMIMSDPYVQSDAKTIAVFSDQNQTLSYLGHGQYLARVDLRYLDSGRKGENVGGTKLGYLKTIQLNVRFAYSHASTELANSVDEIPGTLTYNKRNGEVLEEKVICQRYHKN